MSRGVLSLCALGLAGASCIPAAAMTRVTGMSQPSSEYRVEARQFSFTPGEIKVDAGTQVRLIVTSADVDHRISITGMNLQRESLQGRQQIIEFLAWPAGTLPIRMCGKLRDDPQPDGGYIWWLNSLSPCPEFDKSSPSRYIGS